ncbi:PREDICTED: mitochondrial arginine transporter BAC2-like [Nelumbo nucifera]|uniref:Mitochondrial arginine transporter BAC2-like n=1 Tax=Nelumbo nucifera TaxID=4432 RepID=A0A1U7ZKD6_NELNU|nr:PREDICTED: mitochondrial arginine transporter BAC2-like [Nelumbo nucifera]
MAGVVSGYPLDTLRIRLQQPTNANASAFGLLRNIVSAEGPAALYRGMGAPLVSVSFQFLVQNAIVFQIYGAFSRALHSPTKTMEPPPYTGVALAGLGTGVVQSFLLSPVELVKIRLQLRTGGQSHNLPSDREKTPMSLAKGILRRDGVRGMYRGLTVTTLRDGPAHAFYFWTYEYAREQLHPGCRKSGQESVRTMLVAGGLAGVASWVCCYPLDVVKTRLQSQSQTDNPPPKYRGIVDCFYKSVQEEGYRVLWRGLGTAVYRSFLVNGAVFAAFELSLRCLFSNSDSSHGSTQTQENKL